MNIWDFVIVAAVAAVAGLALARMIRDKRAGKRACGCDCGSCAYSCGCGRRKRAE